MGLDHRMVADEPFTCLICNSRFYRKDRTFEGRLLNDKQFCPSCWTEIMTTEYQADVDKIVLPQMVAK
jgi:hypothetical protein